MLCHCGVETVNLFKEDFYNPVLFEELCLSLPESNTHGSEKDKVIFRASPHFEAMPWYDFVSVAVSVALENNRTAVRHYAAKLLAFVELQAKTEQHVTTAGMFAYVEFYLNAVPLEEREPLDRAAATVLHDDLSVVSSINGLPYVEKDPNNHTALN